MILPPLVFPVLIHLLLQKKVFKSTQVITKANGQPSNSKLTPFALLPTKCVPYKTPTSRFENLAKGSSLTDTKILLIS